MVLGTFAYCGSGQDTLANSFCKYFAFNKYSIGDLIREIAEKNKLDKTRTTLRFIRVNYDKIYGRNYFPKLLIGKIKKESQKNAIITGIRTEEEFQMFHDVLNMKLIFVYADENIRFARMLNRGAEKDERTLNALKQQMQEETDYFDYDKLKEKSSLTFNFNMSLQAYIKDEKNIVKKLLQDLGEVKYE